MQTISNQFDTVSGGWHFCHTRSKFHPVVLPSSLRDTQHHSNQHLDKFGIRMIGGK